MTLKLQTSRLLSIAVAFVAPLALSAPLSLSLSLPAQAQGSSLIQADLTGRAEGGPEADAAPGQEMFAMALPGGAPPMDAPGDAAMMDMGARFLKGDVAVTDDQYEKLYQLRSDYLDKMGPKLVELFTYKRHLKDALTNANIDSSRVNDLKNKIAGAAQDMANMKIDNEIATMNVYTAEQRKHLRLAMMKCPGLSGGWGHHMRGGGMHGRSMHGMHGGGMRGMHGGGMHDKGMHGDMHEHKMHKHGDHEHGSHDHKGPDSDGSGSH